MYNRFHLALKYLHYWLDASNGKGHGIHSPFVFEFVTNILNDRTRYPVYNEVEALRRKLLNDKKILGIEDLGAGSVTSATARRSISSIVSSAAKPAKFGQLLYRMVNYYKPATILELGTSLGITTCYLAKANPPARVITLEGAREVLSEAKDNFNKLDIANIETMEGNFDDTLAGVVRELESVDFCFIDGNHRLQPTIRYFEMLLPKIHNFSILVFDDIHWSREMEKAWSHCRNLRPVTLSIDLFFIGLLIFRKEIREKQHFCIRF